MLRAVLPLLALALASADYYQYAIYQFEDQACTLPVSPAFLLFVDGVCHKGTDRHLKFVRGTGPSGNLKFIEGADCSGKLVGDIECGVGDGECCAVANEGSFKVQLAAMPPLTPPPPPPLSPPPPPPPPLSPPSDEKDDPCFSRNTYTIGADGGAIPMASLKSGDVVMDGPNSFARVIVNQHREATFKSGLLSLEHTNGELSLTPDHVLEVDGKFVPARLATPGSKLGGSEVSRVTATAGEVINPVTTSGKILTQGGVLATTYPEWIAEYMLSSYLVPLPLSFSNLLSYLFPETAQAYYDALIEPLVTKAHPKHLKAALPAPLLPAAFLAGDLAVSAGFAGFALASPLAAVAAAAVFLAAEARK